jgi:hypothetical protein
VGISKVCGRPAVAYVILNILYYKYLNFGQIFILDARVRWVTRLATFFFDSKPACGEVFFLNTLEIMVG